jgi:hypothetical protein
LTSGEWPKYASEKPSPNLGCRPREIGYIYHRGAPMINVPSVIHPLFEKEYGLEVCEILDIIVWINIIIMNCEKLSMKEEKFKEGKTYVSEKSHVLLRHDF